MVVVNKRTYYFEVGPPGSKYLFYEVKRESKRKSTVVRRFQRPSEEKNLLVSAGQIAVHNHSFYFAGRSEPLIKRYNLSGKDVKLVWSRGVIDTYNSNNNYQKPRQVSVSGGGSGKFFGYTKNAQFASEGIAVDDHFYI